MKTNSTLTVKMCDLAVGFFGWFLTCSIGFLVTAQDTSRTGLGHYVFPVLTAIVMGILFLKKRNWFAYGIVAALITNMLLQVLLYGSFYGFGWEAMSEALRLGLWYPFFFFVT